MIISTDQGTFNVSITPFIGEMVRANNLTLEEFNEYESILKN